MPTYFDSSFVLAGLLGEPGLEHLAPFWDGASSRVSSALLEAECVTVLRRAAALQAPGESGAFLTSRLEALDRLLAGMSLKDLDGEVLAALRRHPALAECRTLDAVHLATALLCQEHSDHPVILCTLDDRMRRTARGLGFEVRPL